MLLIVHCTGGRSFGVDVSDSKRVRDLVAIVRNLHASKYPADPRVSKECECKIFHHSHRLGAQRPLFLVDVSPTLKVSALQTREDVLLVGPGDAVESWPIMRIMRPEEPAGAHMLPPPPVLAPRVLATRAQAAESRKRPPSASLAPFAPPAARARSTAAVAALANAPTAPAEGRTAARSAANAASTSSAARTAGTAVSGASRRTGAAQGGKAVPVASRPASRAGNDRGTRPAGAFCASPPPWTRSP